MSYDDALRAYRPTGGEDLAHWSASIRIAEESADETEELILETLEVQMEDAIVPVIESQAKTDDDGIIIVDEALLDEVAQAQKKNAAIEQGIEILYMDVGINFINLTYEAIAEEEEEGKTVAIRQSAEQLSAWERDVELYIEEVGSAKITAIDATTRDQVRRSLLEAQRQGMGVEKAARLLRDNWDDLAPKRSVVIARTERISAANFGSLRGAEAAAVEFGLTLKKKWLSLFDGRTRGGGTDDFDHVSAHGQIRATDAPFTVSGESLMFPGDSSLGASVGNLVNCRCSLIFPRS